MLDLLFKLAGAATYRVVTEYRKIEEAGGDLVISLGIAPDDNIASADDEPDDDQPFGFSRERPA
jgi:hypothetical protein